MAGPELQLGDAFQDQEIGRVGGAWRAACGETGWSIREMARPRQNHDFWPIVTSPTMHVAFPIMDRCPASGRLYVVYRQGYTHATQLAPRDGVIMMVTSDDAGRTWSPPRCIYNDPDYDDRNAAVGVMGDGTVVVCWDQYLHAWHQRALVMMSRDGGESWSQAARLGTTENLTCRSRPIELSDGRCLLPIYCHYGTEHNASFALLMDLASGEQEQIAIPNEPAELGSGEEITVVETEPGRVLALIRSNELPWLIETWSEDCGRTWSPRRFTEIPSQFAPCDLIKLTDGRLACSFSFRERRNERLVLSEDGGRTWDVGNSLDIFDATVGIGDRSYVSSAVLDEHTVGSVLYETEAYPRGGRIWLARTDLRQSRGTTTRCLHHAGGKEDDMVTVDLDGSDCTVCLHYRFTGRFELDKQGGIELRLRGDGAEVGYSYWMGTSRGPAGPATNRWELKLEWGAQADEARGDCQGDSFNDGNEHSLVLTYRGGTVTGSMDDHRQVERPWPGLRPKHLDIVAHNASLAVYKVEVWR